MGFRIWLSFDLGIDGNYSDLYAFLDDKGAKECGESLATMVLPSRADLDRFITEIKKRTKPRKTDRLYVVYAKENGGVTGKFIHGARKRSPWAGYSNGVEEDDTDE